MRVRAAVAAAVLAGAAVALVPASAATGVTVTPAVTVGSGLGFDACEAPSTAVLRAWTASPYRSVNIYFGGSQRGCPNQPELTPDWVTTVLSNGWSLIPTYVDLQAPCNTGVKGKMNPATAAGDGAAAGADAAQQLQALGIAHGVAYLDLEPFDIPAGDTTCGPTVIAFTDAWTQALHAAGHLSGVYVNAHHGAQTFVDAYPADANRADDIWVADWNSQPTPDDAVLGTAWTGHRLHQYFSDDANGSGSENYGGETIGIDRDAIAGDVVHASSVTTPTGPPFTYAVSGTPTNNLNERSAPDSSTGSIQATAKNGDPLNIVCQAGGESVDGDVVWDKLDNGYYVTDIYTTTTGGNGFSAAIPRCDGVRPSVTIRALARAVVSAGVTVSWQASDPANSDGAPNGISSTLVRYRWAPWNGSLGGWHTLTTTSGSSARLPTKAGFTYCVVVQARDLSGNASAWSAQTCTARALDDRSLSLGSGWTRKAESHRYMGTYTSTSSPGRALTRTGAVASRLAVVATTCRSCGSVSVRFAGHTIGTINLHAASTHYQQIFLLPAMSARSGTVVITTTSNSLVQIDGLVISRV